MGTFYTLENAGNFVVLVESSVRQAALRGLVSAAQRTVSYIQNDIIPSLEPVPVARSVYRAGWTADVIPDGAVVENTVPYAMFIENGVLAGSVKIGKKMIAALAEWVRMKGIGGRVVTSKSGISRLKRATADEAVQIAWAIAKSMQKKGIFNGGKGFAVMERAERKAPDFIREEVINEIEREFA